MSAKVTEFELKVLKYIARHNLAPFGDKMVHYAAAVRRLEKKGLVIQLVSPHFYTTREGDACLKTLTDKETTI